MPLAIVILLLVAAIYAVLTVIDKQKPDGGNPLKRKSWMRISVIFVVVSVFVMVFT